MQDKIGEVAGEVWNFLDSEGEASVSAIVDSLDASRSKTQMAIGWLAKEGKLDFEEKGRGNSVSLE